MRRYPRDPHDDPPPPGARYKQPVGPIPTIGQLLSERHGKWVRVWCKNPACGHYAAVPLAPFAIRWGMNASSDYIRKFLRCAECGAKGVSISLSLDPFPPPDRRSGTTKRQ
jgi:hypothetical protein